MPEPTVFGRYQLLEPLAKGGMAEVFKARLGGAAGTEKLVCIKRILPHLSRNNDFLSLFVKEARVALPLTHGNITQVFDFGEEQGVYYLAMEYIAGRNLNEVLRRVKEGGSKLDIPATLYIAAEVCKGLQYAHSFVDANGQRQVVVHRDVTPQNILISFNGEVKLTDFGIALAATKMAGGEDGQVRGKACYLSPEQTEGHPGMPASDIFSLGAVLYETLTGLRVFQAETETETLANVRRADVEPPSQHNPEVDGPLDALVMKALARDPAQRFAKAGDMQVALTSLLHKRSPDFTADQLAVLLKDLFAWELQQGTESGGDAARDRLLFQLARAGVKVDPAKTSTEELLELGTVAIASAGSRPRRRRWLPFVLGGAGTALAAAAVVIFALSQGQGQVAAPDAGRSLLPAYEGTEHLAPVSVKSGSGATPASQPAATPGQHPGSASEPKGVVRKPGYLNCNSWPWSLVFIDGRRLRGNTPFFRVRVTPGRHRIRFENPELGLSREVNVQVDPGDEKTVAVTLQQ